MDGDAKTLTIDDVKHVAELAKLNLNEEEVAKFQGQLSSILDYVKQLQEVDTEGVEETPQVTGLESVMREDSAVENLSQEEALSNVKNKHNGYVKVPGILETTDN